MFLLFLSGFIGFFIYILSGSKQYGCPYTTFYISKGRRISENGEAKPKVIVDCKERLAQSWISKVDVTFCVHVPSLLYPRIVRSGILVWESDAKFHRDKRWFNKSYFSPKLSRQNITIKGECIANSKLYCGDMWRYNMEVKVSVENHCIKEVGYRWTNVTKNGQAATVAELTQVY